MSDKETFLYGYFKGLQEVRDWLDKNKELIVEDVIKDNSGLYADPKLFGKLIINEVIDKLKGWNINEMETNR